MLTHDETMAYDVVYNVLFIERPVRQGKRRNGRNRRDRGIFGAYRWRIQAEESAQNYATERRGF